MLEQLRRNSRSFIIWVLFGIIIAVFIINFGPQANQTIGCGASSPYVMDIDGGEVDEHGWRFAMNTSQGRMTEQQRREQSLELLLAREILAQAAEKAGFRVDTDMVNEHIKVGDIYVLGQRADGDVAARDRLAEEARATGKPENIISKIVDGRMSVYYRDDAGVLAEQPFAKDDSKTVRQVLAESGLKAKSFLLWVLGK